jgi:hypothetical protein
MQRDLTRMEKNYFAVFDKASRQLQLGSHLKPILEESRIYHHLYLAGEYYAAGEYRACHCHAKQAAAVFARSNQQCDLAGQWTSMLPPSPTCEKYAKLFTATLPIRSRRSAIAFFRLRAAANLGRRGMVGQAGLWLAKAILLDPTVGVRAAARKALAALN